MNYCFKCLNCFVYKSKKNPVLMSVLEIYKGEKEEWRKLLQTFQKLDSIFFNFIYVCAGGSELLFL